MKYVFAFLSLLLLIPSSLAQEVKANPKEDVITKLVPPEVLFKRSQQQNFSISPNGQFFAYVQKTNKERDIIIVDIDGYKMYSRIPMGRTSIQNMYWLNDARILYESLGEILAIDIDGSNSTTIVNKLGDVLGRSFYQALKNVKYNNVISLMPQNKREILIETFNYEGYAAIKRVNIYTGEKFTVIDGKRNEINKWITDAFGNVRFGIHYEDEGYSYLKLNEDNEKWEQFYVTIDGNKYALKIDATSYLSQNLSFEGFGYDPNIIYITSNVNSDKRKLVSYNLEQNKVEDVIISDVNCDINDPHGDDIGLIFDFNTGELAGVRYESLTPQHKWFSDRFANIVDALGKEYPTFIHDIIDSDADNNRLLIYQWSDNNAGNIGVYDVTEKSYAVMFHFNDELNKYKLSKTKSIIAKARDDYKLPCYVNLPLDYNSEIARPLVVIPHGGPWSRDYWRLDDFSQYFASRGYVTLRVNFRGSTGFGKKHVLSGVNSIDEIMINDIADAVNFTSDKYNIDKDKIFIFGHSYGGYATYMSIIKYPDLYASGVAVSAPSDIKDWMKKQKKDKNHFSYEFWNEALGSKQSKYLSKISPINFVEEMNKPLLIFHGKKDKIIPLDHAQNMMDALQKEGKNAKLEVLQNEGHSFYDGNSLGYIMDLSDEFFKNNKKE